MKACVETLVFECKCFTQIIESNSSVKTWLGGFAFLCVVGDKILQKICLNKQSRRTKFSASDFSIKCKLLYRLLTLVANIPKPGIVLARQT